MNVEVLALGIPILALLIPIVAILTAHQRKMAELIHSRQSLPDPSVQQLKAEIAELRERVNTQAIQMDNIPRQPLPAKDSQNF